MSSIDLDFVLEPKGVIRLRYLREEGYQLIEIGLWLETEDGDLEPTERRKCFARGHWEEPILELLTALFHRKVA